MAKTKAVVFIGDMHCGSKRAVAEGMVLDDGDKYDPSFHQLWLLECWGDFTHQVLTLTANNDLIACYGGDMCDGVMHHHSSQTFGVEKDQINLAVSLLRPINSAAIKHYGLRGTSAHGGHGAALDRMLYEELGVKRENIDYAHKIDFGGKLLNWRHHFSTGRMPHTRGNSLQALLHRTHVRCIEKGLRKPSLIVRHHVHLYDDRRDERIGARAITCPAWQLDTEFTNSLSDDAEFSVGGLLWWPEEDKVKAFIYTPKEDEVKTA